MGHQREPPEICKYNKATGCSKDVAIPAEKQPWNGLLVMSVFSSRRLEGPVGGPVAAASYLQRRHKHCGMSCPRDPRAAGRPEPAASRKVKEYHVC